MKNRVVVIAAAGALMMMSLAGCNSSSKHAEAPSNKAVAMVNTKCPYSGEPVNPSVTSQYKGKTVGFCCAGCQGKWAKATDAQRDSMLANAK